MKLIFSVRAHAKVGHEVFRGNFQTGHVTNSKGKRYVINIYKHSKMRPYFENQSYNCSQNGSKNMEFTRC